MVEVDADATSVNSNPIHLVDSPPVFLNRIQASGPTSGDGRVATAGCCKPLAIPTGPNPRKRHKGQWNMQIEREHEATNPGPANDTEDKQGQAQRSEKGMEGPSKIVTERRMSHLLTLTARQSWKAKPNQGALP